MAADAVLGGIVGKIVEKIWDYTVDPIVQQFSYFCCFNRNIEKLETQLGVLQPITQGVQQWVDADHLKGRVIAPRIEAWLKSANDVKSEAGEIIKEKPEVKKGCLNGCIRWCSNFKRYTLSKEAVKKTKVIVNLQKEGGEYTRPSYSPPPTCTKTLPSKDNMAFESRSLNIEEIIKALKEDKVHLIGLCGLPGVGKTTMAKEIGKRAKEDGLFVEVAWAVVGQMPKLNDVQACIADMLGMNQLADRPSPVVRADLLRERLLQDNKKILVILDDVWAKFDLEDMGIPLGGANKNFKMLYTSRNRGLWHDQEITKIEIPLKLLSKDEAWELFKKQVGDCADAPGLQPIAKEIVNACGCLPLALVLIGKALSEESSGNSTMNIWEDVRDRLTCSSSTPEDRDWSPILELSYRAVKDEEAKRLFLLCCLFEEDKAIPVEVLARYALGFSIFHDRIKGMRNTRNRVLKLVADLERRYLLLDDPCERYDKHVKVHDLVRDMGISIASKCKGALGSHGTVSEYPKKDAFEYALVSHGAVSEWPNKDKSQHYTCISVISEETMEFPEELTCPNLEFLLLRCCIPEKLSCQFFKGTEKLKVLELYEYAGIIPILQTWTNLTMLSLENIYHQYAPAKAVIDPVIGSLLNLEILSFRNLGIKMLPEEIGKLIKLRLLDLTGTSRLETIPPRIISRLVRLEELYMMESEFSYWEGEGEEKGINANLREFELLSNLNTLEIRIRSGVLIPKVPIFSKLKKYKVIIESNYRHWYFEGTQYERELFVGTWLGRDIPEGHGVLDSLLRSSDGIWLRDNDLVQLQDNDLLRLQDGVDRLQQLKYLKIEDCKTPECLVNTMNRVQQQPNAVFPTLEKLCLDTNDGLRGICHGPIPAGSFGQLTEIWIYDCNSLKYLFPLPIVEFLTQLKILAIWDCATMEEVIWKEQREDVQIATSNRIEFSKLESLFLDDLSSLVGFCRGIDRIDFPRLIDLHLRNLGKLKRIVHDNNNQSSNSEPNNNVGSLSLFPQMVTFPSLEKLVLYKLKNMSNELPASSLSKLKNLAVIGCDSWRNVFYPPMAAVLVNLQTLTIENCSKMEMIVDWEEGQEREIPKTMFPQLMNLELKSLPCLTRFCHFTHIPIELPLLSKIDISGCRSMNAFFFGPVSAPSFYFQGVSGNINQAIEFMQEEEQRKEEERIKEEERKKEEWRKEEEQRKKEAEEMAKRKGWPMKVKHEFHEHELELMQRSQYCTCDGCEEQGEVWFFCCKDCNFDLHPKCALEENKANKGDNKDGLEEGATTKGWPKKVKHELHEHELELIKRRNYICDGCKERGKLWFFYCEDCDFYLHRKCALEENKATKGDNKDGLEEGVTTKEGWVCDGDVCHKA